MIKPPLHESCIARMLHFAAVGATFSNVRYPLEFFCKCKHSFMLNLIAEPLLEQYTKCFTSSSSREIRTWNSLLRQDYDYGKGGKINEKQKNKQREGVKVPVIKENNVETYMYLSEAEKYAKHRNLTLVQLPCGPNDKVKYKLQKSSKVLESEKVSSDNKSKNSKQIFVREEISRNDLQIKINSMVKLLEKGIKVECVLESSHSEKLTDILNQIDKSELQKYSLQKMPLKKGIKLIYDAQSKKIEEVKPENVNVKNKE